MNKILALDLGEKRIGLALSDALLMFAHPLKTLEWRGFKTFLKDLKEIISENNVSTVVVGMPYTMKGTYSKKTEETAKISNKLKENLDIEVVEADERLTTKMAEQALHASGRKPGKERNRIDQIAAVFILQSYLDGLKP